MVKVMYTLLLNKVYLLLGISTILKHMYLALCEVNHNKVPNIFHIRCIIELLRAFPSALNSKEKWVHTHIILMK